MKKILSILLVSMILFGCSNEQTKIHLTDLTYKNDTYYYKDKIFNGIGYDDRGGSKTEQIIKQGKVVNVKQWRDDNGNPLQDCSYSLDGNYDGICKEWWIESGKLQTEKNWKYGNPIYIKEWYENGEIKSETYFLEDKKGENLFPVKHGLQRKWDQNGNLTESINYKKGKEEGLCFTSYKEGYGQLKVKGNMKNGKEDGKSQYWYENGQLYIEGEFLEGEKHGIFKKWNEDGVLIDETIWCGNIEYSKDDITPEIEFRLKERF